MCAAVSALKKPPVEGHKIDQRIRISLSSSNVQNLQKVADELKRNAKKEGLRVRGPVALPTKILRITTRKTPCGEGSKTWDRFQLRIHKRLIDLYCPREQVKQITSITIERDVFVDVIVDDSLQNQ